MEWQPIETARKDGTEILAYSSEGVKNIFVSVDGHWAVIYWDRGWRQQLVGESGYSTDIDDWKPTHWMNLPKPPQGETT